MATASQTLEPEAAEFLSTTFPQLVRNGTNIPVSALAFDGAGSLDEAAFWKIDLAQFGSGNFTLDFYWYADSGTSGDVKWEAAFAAITADTDTQDVETKSLATAQTVVDSHLGTTAQRLHKCSITLSNTDSVAQADAGFLRVRRLGSDAADTLNSIDALLERVVVSFTAA